MPVAAAGVIRDQRPEFIHADAAVLIKLHVGAIAARQARRLRGAWHWVIPGLKPLKPTRPVKMRSVARIIRFSKP